MRKYILLLFVLCSYLTQAQTITVPDNIYFANQQLRVTDSGKREIQRMVDALTKYPKYYQLKVDLADTYFPIIERVFREEGLPEDFKYLSLQESGLTSDAVSTSNAVGFWQFKKEAATDYGLRINQDVDERKHIIESSRSAARYLVKSNNLYYHNWHNTLLSYLLGFTGAKSYTRPEHQNSREMEVTDRTHAYILTFLAHKVAFENAVGKNESPLVVLQEMAAKPGATLDDIALETQVPATELQRYNKWLAGTYIPYDKSYTVLIPVINPDQETILASRRAASSPVVAVANTNTNKPIAAKRGKREFRKVNGLKVIIARQGDTKDKLADEADLSSRRFMAYNDLKSSDAIIPGEPYYLQRKKSKASVSYHVVQTGERLHQIAQKYGVKERTIIWNNRLKHNENLASGRLLWMQRRRPSNVPVEFQKVYPESAPKQAPVNPGILAKNKAPEVVNTPPATASTQLPTEVKAPTPATKTDFPVNSSVKPGKVVELDTESVMEIIAAETAATDEGEITDVPIEKPIDVALTNTNAQKQKTTETLNQHIDKQVETINKIPAPVVYKKPAAQPTAAHNPDIFTRTNTTETATTNDVVVSPKSATYTEAKKVETVIKASTLVPANGQHEVAKGETLYSISRMYNITVAELKSWNYLSDDTPLRIGDNLKITLTPASGLPLSPAQATASIENAITDTHTVAAGESMYAISRRYGVTIKEIMEWNNKVDFSVRSGEKLIIKAATSQN